MEVLEIIKLVITVTATIIAGIVMLLGLRNRDIYGLLVGGFLYVAMVIVLCN